MSARLKRRGLKDHFERPNQSLSDTEDEEEQLTQNEQWKINVAEKKGNIVGETKLQSYSHSSGITRVQEDETREEYVIKTKDYLAAGKKTTKKTTTLNISPMILIIGVVVIVFVLYLIVSSCFKEQERPPENDLEKQQQTMKKFFEEFVTEYSAYDIRHDYTMRAAVRTILKEKEHKRPGVIALINFIPEEEVLKRLSEHLAYNISIILKGPLPVLLDGKNYRDHDPGQVKHILEDSIISGVENGSQVILVENFHEITADTILLFHGLCDDTNAPYKNLIFIFTLQSQASFVDEKQIEVTDPWKQSLHVEKRSALESRIGTNKVFILTKKEISN